VKVGSGRWIKATELAGLEDQNHLKDVGTIMKSHPELMALGGPIVEYLWIEFSDQRSASWLIVDDDMIRQFIKYLDEEDLD
jgi:hypothetical protein